MPSGFPAQSCRRFGWLGWILLFLYASSVHADDSTNFYLHSTAEYKTSNVPTYIAGLYLSERRESLTPEFAFEYANTMAFKILRSRLSSRSWGRDLIQKSVINNAAEVVAQRAAGFQEFSELLTEWLYEGDFVELRRQSGGMSFHVNGTEIGYVEDPELFSALLKVWIGEVPPSSEFKNSLLNHSLTQEQAKRFSAQSDVVAREARAREWLALLKPVQEVLVDNNQLPSPSFPTESDQGQGEPVSSYVDSEASLAENLILERQRLAEKEQALVALQAEINAEKQKQAERERREQEQEARETIMNEYTRVLYRHPNKFIRYPLRSQARREQGLVEIMVQINRDGKLVKAELATSSDYPRLDKAAITAVQEANPFPGVPSDIPGDVFEFIIPLSFRIQ